MNEFEEEIYADLLTVLEKIAKFEVKQKAMVVDTKAIMHISYALDYITHQYGFTDKTLKAIQDSKLSFQEALEKYEKFASVNKEIIKDKKSN